ncbi:hypothetical protein [Actinomadura kijaniata]|uniref:hypothetical protein n=1 Tax=Actinomadura kijaniata TaxID=46161 RepID=UPI0012F7B927|nr:hypothetical protein [Actinomadura kijaniata]
MDFDSYLCASYDRWTNGTCWDDSCAFCRNRPERPSLARELVPDDEVLRRAARRAGRRRVRARRRPVRRRPRG